MIKTLRNQLGLTQTALANELGVTTGTISKWERDEQNAPPWLTEYLSMKVKEKPEYSLADSINRSVKDPFFQEILDRLNGKVNPSNFEKCVSELLGLAGVPVIAIGKRRDDDLKRAMDNSTIEPSPLLVTTETDIRQTVERNLENALTLTQSRRLYLATTKNVTPKIRQKIRNFAESHGFVVWRVFDQHWVATQLYHNKKWREILLSITKRVPVLCSVPDPSRIFTNKVLVGREEESAKLLKIEGDCILSGPPGSGKTSLLCRLLEHGALFLCNDDKRLIARNIKDMNPSIILVDDAQIDDERIKTVQVLRQKLGVSFQIVVACWSFKDLEHSLQRDLQITENQTIRLGSLNTRQICEILKAQGISNRFLQSIIVEQAQGMPGLAVSLAQMCDLINHSGVDAVISGAALLEKLMPKFLYGVQEDIRPLLAAISVGGTAGMPLRVIARYFRMEESEVTQKIHDLIFAGVVYTSYDGHLAIRPYRLTFAFVFDAYFNVAVRIEDFKDLFSLAPSKAEAVCVLIYLLGLEKRVRHRKEILAIIEDHVGELSNLELAQLASIGTNEAHFVIDTFPERILDTARGFLRIDPELLLPKVFEHVVDPEHNFIGTFSQFQELIEAWISEMSPEFSEAMIRRIALIKASIKWYKQQKSVSEECAKVVNFNLNKAFEGLWEGTTPSPIEMQILYYSCVPNYEQTKTFIKLWTEAVECVSESARKAKCWMDSVDLIRQWTFALGRDHPNEQTIFARKQLANLIRTDLAQRFKKHPGLLVAITRFDKDLPDSSEVIIDREFQILMANPFDGGVEEGNKQLPKTHEKYLKLGAETTAKTLSYYEQEAQRAKILYYPLMYELCRELAEAVNNSLEWLSEFLKMGCTGQLVKPFINKCNESNSSETINLISNYNTDNKYVIELFDLSKRDREEFAKNEELFLKHFARNPKDLDMVYMSSDIDDRVIQSLLKSRDSVVAYLVALNYFKEKNRAPAVFKKEWQEAILNHKPQWQRDLMEIDYLEKILCSDHQLAMQWLRDYFNVKRPRQGNPYGFTNVPVNVIKSLPKEIRIELLTELNFEYSSREEINAFVHFNPEVYKFVLKPELQLPENFKLAPLTDIDENRWRELLVVALESGLEDHIIAEAVVAQCVFQGKFESEEKRIKKFRFFDAFDQDSNEQVVKTVRFIKMRLERTDNRLDG